MNKPTLVIGASSNEERYSNKAIAKLKQYKHTVFALGLKQEIIHDIPCTNQQVLIENIHTITLYINAKLQQQYYAYIVSLQPKRIIFNPGTENEDLITIAEQHNIEAIEACTLVMLSTDQY